ncbi:MAG: hydrogenase nickel incorporation protein HypB [Nocardioides sp.]
MGRFHRHDDGTEHTHEHSHVDGHEDGHGHGHDGHGHEEGHEHEHGHGDHSAYETGGERIEVLERIFDENDRAAAANRAALDAAGVGCVNIMSSPGAGKTTLLVHTLRHLQEQGVRAGVVEGDIETSIDADRLAGFGAQISLLNTGNGFGGECHLDAPMVAKALRALDLDALDLVLVENVGNLVCPAEFDVGAHRRVMVYAITEGEEKPLKYPVMFRSVDVVLVNKLDLLPYLDFDLAAFHANVRAVNPTAHVIEVSARTGDGLAEWHSWLTGAPNAGRAADRSP